MKSRVFPIPAALALCFGSLFAQVAPAEPADFSEEAVKLSFRFPGVAAPANLSEVFSRWGIRFSAPDGARPVLANGLDEDETGDAPSVFLPVLSLRHPGDSSAGVPLVVDFRRPVRRVGFEMANGGEGVTAQVEAFSAEGLSLGRFETPEIPESFEDPLFVGLETTAEGGISKVTIGYGEFDAPEQVSRLLVDFVERPLFSTVIAQVGRGPFGLGRRLETIISILNVSATPAQGQIRLFDGTGAPVQPGSESGLSDSDLRFRLPPFLATSFDTRALRLPGFSGYAVIVSDAPVAAAARFQAVDRNGELLSEAGVGADEPRHFQIGFVERRRPPIDERTGLETALALVNASDEQVRIEISVFQAVEPGQAGDSAVRRPGAVFNLGPGEHVARFASQFIPDIQREDFEGSIVIRSSRPVAATLLETRFGLPLSSVPLAPIER